MAAALGLQLAPAFLGLPRFSRSWDFNRETGFYCLGGGGYYQAALGRAVCRGAGSFLNLYAWGGNNLIAYVGWGGWGDFGQMEGQSGNPPEKPCESDPPEDPEFSCRLTIVCRNAAGWKGTWVEAFDGTLAQLWFVDRDFYHCFVVYDPDPGQPSVYTFAKTKHGLLSGVVHTPGEASRRPPSVSNPWDTAKSDSLETQKAVLELRLSGTLRQVCTSCDATTKPRLDKTFSAIDSRAQEYSLLGPNGNTAAEHLWKSGCNDKLTLNAQGFGRPFSGSGK